MAIRKEYSLRRLTVIFFFISLVAAVSLVLLLSSYLLSRVREKGTVLRLEASKAVVNKNTPGEDLATVILTARTNADILDVSRKNVSVYDLFRVFEDKNSAIRIDDLFYTARGKDEIKITVRGTARDRESLIEFEKKLESQKSFSSVDLPISNLAKEKDIDFTIGIVMKN